MTEPTRILVLDDEPLIAMMLQDWLSELGCETVGPVHSAEAALALLDRGPVDAAILDVTLGTGDCYPVACVLQQQDIPFAFATGLGADRIDQRFKDASTLLKPYDFRGVESTVAELTKRRTARRNGA